MALRSLRFLVPLVATSGWILTVWGCSASSSGDNTFDTTSTSSSSSSSGMGSGGSSGEGGGLNFGGSNGQGGFSADASCASSSVQAELTPLDIVILLDRSGSMSGAKWTGSTAALTSFVNDPASAGISVGITYFPLANTGGLHDCTYTLYDDLTVPIGELPMNAAALSASIDFENPGGGTPMYGALKGVLFHATAYQDANPTHKVIVLLASDGDPSGCTGQDSIPLIAELAKSALNYNGVQTYVIAIAGSTLANLNQIAAGGGTGTAYDVTSNIDAFSEKMAEIRASALACEFVLPPPPTGEVLDIAKVAVNFTPGAGTATQVPKADNAADCKNGPGWYYDDNNAPTKIILCSASCSTVQSDAQAKVEVLFGCEPENN